MKKIVHFSKVYIPLVILSLVIIVSGMVVTFTRGINFGIDFKPGLIQEVRIVPPAIKLTYTGTAAVSVETASSGVSLVISGAGADNATQNFYYGQYSTVAEMAEGFNTVDGVSAVVCGNGFDASSGMFTNSEVSSVLSKTPYSLFKFVDSNITIEDVRAALVSIEGSSIKEVGTGNEKSFQIRVGDDGSSKEVSNNIKKQIITALSDSFGSENIAVVKTDFIGAQFSKSLATSSAILVILTLGLIWIYATIRFKWDFAMGAVLAIMHDALIMVVFMAFTQMEFTAISIAAILTIVGYSINDTIVILDRVRENYHITNMKSFKELFDFSQTEMLGRTIITSVTTLLAVLSLYLFTTGSMKDFALALIVGMISGVYSTIFIAGAFICFCRRNWKLFDEVKQTVVPTVM